MTLLDKKFFGSLQASYSRLTPGEKLVAEYLSANLQVAAFMTCSELGKASGVSETTVIRLAGTLGYSGYSELKKAMQKLVRKSLSTSDQLDSTIRNIGQAGYLNEIYELDQQNLSQTFYLNSTQDIEQAVTMMCRAGKLIIAGLGLSTGVVRFLSGRLRRIKKDVIEINATGHVLVEKMAMATGEDLLIAFSFPSYSKDMPKVFRHMKEELGGKTMLISDSRVGETQRFADLVLLAVSDSLAFTNSMVAPFMLANMLSVGVALQNQEGSLEQLRKNQLLADTLGHSFSSFKGDGFDEK
ncbi:MurR/RpiR family transcriptional regulator [Dethiosulfatarculus sandiegensis]|uniref:Transcriptional regulator n=1 Tax=Dethiosulfatarculus sandiegensis TaxID=1429043 RepID=A0A0D2JMS3_9BACT|nr:MurR/RpiR family transcriptional regulator [Dethiosulfatarculus sandiegensis]KIX10790.1 hypothetical protein X474_27715 [Dethiosulfatarculus sandiegensis]